jgi:hypothetical protein
MTHSPLKRLSPDVPLRNALYTVGIPLVSVITCRKGVLSGQAVALSTREASADVHSSWGRHCVSAEATA